MLVMLSVAEIYSPSVPDRYRLINYVNPWNYNASPSGRGFEGKTPYSAAHLSTHMNSLKINFSSFFCSLSKTPPLAHSITLRHSLCNFQIPLLSSDNENSADIGTETHCNNFISTTPWSKTIFSLNTKRVSEFRCPSVRFLNCAGSNSGRTVSSAAAVDSTSPVIKSGVSWKSTGKLEAIEEDIEKVIYRCRFMAILGVLGSLIGSFLCFIKGCTFVTESFKLYLVNRSKVILLLVEAIDLYLLGTVMLVFGMGLYELFISNLGSASSLPEQKSSYRSNFFGLFALKERPQWLDIKTVNELKTKLGHVIVMLLLIGLLDKSKKAAIHSPVDLLCFCASVFLSSSCLFLLSKLNDDK